MGIKLLVVIIILFTLTLILFRVIYTNKRMDEVAELIGIHIMSNIYMNSYEVYIPMVIKMRIPYIKYLVSLHLWGKYSAIKPEYKELLLPNQVNNIWYMLN